MRAESVATYLREVWGISPSRVGVRWQASPSVPTNSAWPEGLEENRRVEIEVSDPSLLDPVMLRSVEPVTQPESIAFRPSVTASRAITSWRLELDDPFGRLSDVSGTGAPPPEIEWRLTQEDRERILSTGSVGFQFSVQDAAGALLVSSRGEMPLRLDTTVTVASSAGRPATTAEFLLITFEFDQARLNLRGRRELETIVSRIGPESTVEVVGYTDRLGDAAHNLALASERARAVASQLPSGTPVISRGAPADEAPYDNSLPQGRFLNRTVRVVVNNPR
jgi:outer membrane protein OmpA-like peptidoglycan-associated protein